MSTPGVPAGRGTPRYGMVVDLNRCVGCQTCTIACKHHNDTPPGVQWRRVLDVEQGEYPNVERAVPRDRLPALRGAALRPGVSDRGHPAAG